MAMTSRLSVAAAVLLAGGLVLAGCSSGPGEEELRQLNELRDQASALQREVSSLEQQKNALEREIAEKNAKLKKCADDQQVVRQRLAK
ncbi:MAG: hypothetical protein WB626_05575 [Bacteroidota bacterium]